jgi:hypothetical protein
MKITFGRKFFGCTIATVLIAAVYFVTLAVQAEAITAAVTTTYGGFILTVWFAYIGGNVWSKWVKSKHFQEGLK